MKRLIFLTSVIVFFLFTIGVVSAAELQKGRISGKLMIKDGGPMGEDLVHFFNAETGPIPDPDKYWRVPDFITDIKENGEFTTELNEGKYYIGAIKRISGKKEVGPPLIGDFFFISQDEKGTPKLYIVKKGEDTNIGTISEAIPFKGWGIKDKITAIEGRVLIEDGKPVEGALVFAYSSSAMSDRPEFISDRTDKDGKFILRVYEGGTYYLRARDLYGGGPPATGGIIGTYRKETSSHLLSPSPPGPSGLVGIYGKETSTAIVVNTGEIKKGIDINVVRFPGRGPKKD
jgi:hypothetical protein